MKKFFKRHFSPLMMIVVIMPSLLTVSEPWYRYLAIAVIIMLFILIIFTEIKHKKAP
ncbi:MAG: hypothetical protein P8L83_05720 [Flavobacteriaceae bacterium]|nr:hypothetical protein [Flavobacteriaceae bacterium]